MDLIYIMQMNIFAIIVTYNGMRWYDRCFDSLRNSEQMVSIVVVDNASTDKTVEYINTNYPEIHLIKSNENLGFAKANNIGIRYAIDNDAEYVFLLNQDAWIENNSIGELLKTFSDNKNVGIASPIHLNGTYTGLDWGFVNCMDECFVSDAFLKKLKHYYEVPFVNAAAWLISSECIKKVGGFDTSLFIHYGEDDNYSQRVIYHGYKTIVNTSCTICHDREFRKDYEDDYRNRMTRKNPLLYETIMYGNINKEINIDEMIRKQYLLLLRSFIAISKNGVNYHLRMIRMLKNVRRSRCKNIKPGLLYL